jgi:serine protease Do
MLTRLLAISSVLLLPLASASAQSLVDVASRVRPAVVTIMAATEVPAAGAPGGRAMSGSIGSGVFISRTQVLTAYHVVGDADTVIVQTATGARYSARVTRQATVADVALLEVLGTPNNQPIAPLGNSDGLRIAEPVFVIGAPLGMDFSVSSGILSARRRPAELADLAPVEYLQTDAAINHGNSGGPLLNMRGEVVGVVSFILSESGGSVGLGFAIAANTARALLLDEAMPFLGVAFTPLPPALAAALNVPGGHGYLVEHVARNSLGRRIGLRAGQIPVAIGGDTLMIGGDIIVEIQGVSVQAGPESAVAFRRAITSIPTGQVLRLKVLRNGEILELMGPVYR